jgi:predicted deacetylase
MEDNEDFQMKIFGYSLLALIVAYTLYNTGNGVLVSIRSDNNLDRLTRTSYSCRELEPVRSENKVVLRIDDIQANYLGDVSQKMINDAASREMKTFLAVIPYRLDSDRQTTTYLRTHSCWFEPAMHGWDNGLDKGSTDIPEFEGLDYAEAVRRLRLGKESMHRGIGVVPTSFVPPDNEYSVETAIALKDESFLVVSAEGEGAFDYDTSTYDFLQDKLIPADRVLKECIAAIEVKKYCVVMMHPQDFITEGSLDSAKYAEYLKLLDGLQEYGVEAVTMSELSQMIER